MQWQQFLEKNDTLCCGGRVFTWHALWPELHIHKPDRAVYTYNPELRMWRGVWLETQGHLWLYSKSEGILRNMSSLKKYKNNGGWENGALLHGPLTVIPGSLKQVG